MTDKQTYVAGLFKRSERQKVALKSSHFSNLCSSSMNDWLENAAKVALDAKRIEKKCAPCVNDEVSCCNAALIIFLLLYFLLKGYRDYQNNTTVREQTNQRKYKQISHFQVRAAAVVVAATVDIVVAMVLPSSMTIVFIIFAAGHSLHCMHFHTLAP